MDSDKACKKCEKSIYKDGFCYEHFREYHNKAHEKWKAKNYEAEKKRQRDWHKKGNKFICKECGVEFDRRYLTKFCSQECFFKNAKKNNAFFGKNNSQYKTGFYVDRKKNQHIQSKATVACKKYRQDFLNKNDYLYCEKCKCNINKTFRFEVHHIVFLSEAPYHKMLNDKKNLVLLCKECHLEMHGRKREMREELVKDRGLEKLFDKKLL